MLVYEVRDTRQRVRAHQRTPHACAAASVIDAVGDFAGWGPQALLQAQALLIGRLGGLRTQGTTLPVVAQAARLLFGKVVEVDVATADIVDAIMWAASGAGVVVGLAPPSGRGEGHAVRIRAGDVPDLGPFNGLPPAVRRVVLPRDAMDLMGTVQLFDPWPGPEQFPELVRYGDLRRRFELFGGAVLVISPRRQHPPRVPA